MPLCLESTILVKKFFSFSPPSTISLQPNTDVKAVTEKTAPFDFTRTQGHSRPMKADQALIYSDGACSGNPGPGGWGTIVAYGNKVKELGGGQRATTNNKMEMTGALEGLK